MAKVVHFEIPVEDENRAQQFYNSVFGWSFEGWGDSGGGGYWLTAAGGEDEQGVGGALISRGDLHRAPVVIVGVESTDDALKAAVDAGAEVLSPSQPIPGVGYAGYFRDTEGNVIGVFHPDESASD